MVTSDGDERWRRRWRSRWQDERWRDERWRRRPIDEREGEVVAAPIRRGEGAPCPRQRKDHPLLPRTVCEAIAGACTSGPAGHRSTWVRPAEHDAIIKPQHLHNLQL